MPIYEYKCNKCDKEFEFIVFGKEDEVECPECNGKDVERRLSACSFKSNGTYSAPSSGGGSSCSGCTSSNCSSCH